MILFLDFDGVLHPDAVYLERGRPVLRTDGELFMWSRHLVDVLASAREVEDHADAFAELDYNIFRGLAFASGNPIYGLILNGMKGLYTRIGRHYFANPEARSLEIHHRDLRLEQRGLDPLALAGDRALLQRVLGAGGLVYSTHELGYLYVRHESGHTWDAGLDYFRDAPRRRDWPGRLPHPELGTVAAGPAAGTPA